MEDFKNEEQKLNVPSKSILLKAKQQQIITKLFKNFLFLLEEIVDEHDEALEKFKNTLPKEYQDYIYLADHFTNTKCDSNRKKILGAGNDAIRELSELVDSLKIDKT